MEHNQENQKTQVLDINDLLKEAGIRTEEKPAEEVVNTEELEAKLLGDDFKAPEPAKREIKEEPVNPPASSTKYSEKLKELIELGLIEDVQINIGEEEGEEKVAFLSELEDLDKNSLEAIISNYKEAKDKELQEKYISTDGLDERTRKYIELKKNGGDPSQLIQEEIQYVNPWQQLDLDDEQVQEYIVRQKLSLNPELDEEDIERKIAKFKNNLSLDTEAKKIYDEVQKNFDTKVEQTKKAQLEEIEKEKQYQKEFRKNISQELKTLIPNENVAKVILDNATKRDEHGLTNTDKLYFDAQKDPKLYSEIAFFLNNREKFYEAVGAKAKLKEAKKTVQTLFSINTKAVKEKRVETKKDDEAEKVFDKLTSQFQNK